MSEEIKPCPWCGSDGARTGRYDGRYAVFCSGRFDGQLCRAIGGYKETEAEAIESWNRVASSSALVQSLEAALDKIAAIGCSYKEPCDGMDGLTCGSCLAVHAMRSLSPEAVKEKDAT